MSNPFEVFAEDDDDNFQPSSNTEPKVKRTHQEKRLYKQAATKPAEVAPQVFNEADPERIRENAKQIRNNRAPPSNVTKKLGDGHYHDRQSGTGRPYHYIYSATDQEKKAEERETSEMSRMSSTLTNTSNKAMSKLIITALKLPILKEKNLKSPKNLKNLKL
jgi:hypothetical protein